MSPRTRMLAGFLAVNLVIVLVAALVIYNRPATPPLIQGVLLPQARDLDDFRLVDHDNQPFTNEDLEGRWHIVSYGFTTCPDVCPTTLAQLAEMTRRLEQTEQGAEDLQVLFYSVDHRRDTVAQMASYVPYFHPDFVGLTHRDNSANPHLPFERSLGIAARLVPNTEPGAEADPNDYEVNHGVALFLINPQGKLQAVFEPERVRPDQHRFDPNRILQDYLAIREYLG
ncbi:MAG: SCO family protein [Halioglobus sp.]|nr:SCO family protein [Halioglobus sp.]